MAMFAGIAALAAVCGCVRLCRRCNIRDCLCIKRFLRLIGHDGFDDFECMILVHDATFDGKEMGKTIVRVTAGSSIVQTDANSNGVFQQPLHIEVEQGTEEVIIDLMDNYSKVLATLSIDVLQGILKPTMLQPEMIYNMKQKGKGIRNPKIKLTMVVSEGGDEEQGLLSGAHEMTADLDILVRQQLKKAKQEGAGRGDEQLSEMEVLKQACTGPLELFEGLGKTHTIFAAVIGPPASRRWILGVWNAQKDFEEKKHAIMEIDLLKIQSVQPDPARHHVFVINCFDESRVRKALTFRRIDRARDVWVEILHLLVTKARETKHARKTLTSRQTPASSSRAGGRSTTMR